MKKLLLGTAMTVMAASGSMADTYRAECFAPAPGTSTIQGEAKDGPYKIAFVNGFAGNDWRIAEIQASKAWAARP